MTKQVKIVFDGQRYWLLWDWQYLITPSPLKNILTHAESFPTLKAAEEKASAGDKWQIIPFISSATQS